MINTKDLFSLEGRVAIVTGGRGMYGTSISLGLCEMGATVVISSRNGEKCEELAKELRDQGYSAYGMSLDLNSDESIETFVQAKQGWWEKDGVGVATFYTVDTVGGYFLYNMPCSKEDYDKMVPGTHIRVTGWKAEYAGEIEIIDCTYEILTDGTWIAEATDVTELLAAENLADYMNRFVSIKGATVAAANEAGDAFMYKWNGSGSEGDDLYFCVTVGDATYTFCVESYLCGVGSEAYEAVRALKVGDKIDLEGFLYWYNGAQPHVTGVKAAA
jgi:hypothetical protein